MDSTPSVFILLLNYRGTDDTFACLDSLKALNYSNYRVVVIDNQSPDDSVSRLKNRLAQNPSEFTLIESPENWGYSGGNNLGIREALLQANKGFVWLLNNDTTIEPDTLDYLVQEAQRTGGLSGSLLLHPDGAYQQVGTRIHWWTGSAKGYRANKLIDGMAVDTLSGASMLIPLRAFHAVGLLDSSFFLYFEDAEFSYRCAQKGFPLTVAIRSRVYHKEGATTGRKSLSTQYYYHRNRMKMLFLFANPFQKMSIAGYALFRLLRSVVKSVMSRDSGRRVSARVQWLAWRDFQRGIDGPCPHNLENLQ
jgi:GT2 family glycosyltransferase